MLKMWMLLALCPGRGSFIAGKSMHNTRIERLWRDVYEAVLSSWYIYFRGLEEQGLLDPKNDLHLYVLHYIYTPVINEMLSAFVGMLNNHKLRLENHKTPIQLFIIGMHAIATENCHCLLVF